MFTTVADFDFDGVFEQEGSGGGGRAGRFNMCAETINP